MRDTRVLHIINSLDRGGAESNLARLCAESAQWGVDNTVLTLTNGGVLRDSIARDARVLAAANVFNTVRTLSSRRSATRPDLVVGWMYLGCVAAAVVAGTRFPTIWCVRHVPTDLAQESLSTRASLRWMRNWCRDGNRRRPRLVVVNSERARATHEALGVSGRYRVIANGVDVVRFAPDQELRRATRLSLGIGDEDVVVLQVGRAHPHKGQTLLLDAASEVLAAAPSTHFVMIGAGVPGMHHPVLAARELTDRIHRLDDRDDLQNFYVAADVLVSPSLTESFPTVVVEAMSCGLPCVVTDSGASAEIVGTTGFVVAPGSKREIVDGLMRMIRLDRAVRGEMGQAARRRVVERYTLSTMTREFADAYRTVAGAA